MSSQFVPKDMPEPTPPTIPTDEDCSERLKKHIELESKGLKEIIEEKQLLVSSEYVKRAVSMFNSLVKPEFGCPGTEIGMNLVILTLYDIVVLIDDSHSMKKDPKLLPSLQSVIEQICEIYELANPNGINSIRFMNHHQARKNAKKADVKSVVNSSPYTGVSRIGTELHRRVLDNFVMNKFVSGKNTMERPLLVLTFTDGVVEGEGLDLLGKVIWNCLSKLDPKLEGREEAVAFQFICLSEDEGAKKLFQFVDDHNKIGHRVDCVLPAYHQLDTINSADKWNGPGGRKWHALSKILLGALLTNFDNHDEDLELPDIDFDPLEVQPKRSKEINDDN